MRRQSAGFSLVEVLVSVVLLGLVVLAVVPMFLFGIRRNAAGADTGVVGALGVARMEQLRRAPYADLTAGGSLTSDVTQSGTPYFDDSANGFVVRWTISDAATPDGGKELTVRALALRQISGMPKEVMLTTLRGG